MNLDNSYFVIGTDTDIGKTYVSSLLYKGLKKYSCSYYKPIQSGGVDGRAPDVDFLCSFNNIEYSKEMEGYIFEEPVSPHLAAEIEGRVVDIEKIREKIEIDSDKNRFSIIEGAGGIYVPIVRDKITTFDLIKKLKMKVILVASTKVGTINHTMLTLEFLKNRGIEVQGIIFNRYTGKFYEDDNMGSIISMGGIKNYLVIDEECKEIEEDSVKRFFGIKGERCQNLQIYREKI